MFVGFPVTSGGAILSPRWLDRPVIWGMSVKIIIRNNGRELRDLIKGRIEPSRFGVVEDECHMVPNIIIYLVETIGIDFLCMSNAYAGQYHIG